MVDEKKEEGVSRSNARASRQIALTLPKKPVSLKTPKKVQRPYVPICKHLFLWLILPLLILITGVLLRNLIPIWVPIPVEYIIVLISLLTLFYALTLVFSYDIRYLSIILLGLISICGIILVALLTQVWSAFWAWLTILIPLTAFATMSGTMIGSEILDRCRKTRRRVPFVIRHRSNGVLKLTITDQRREKS